jgi:hypothetical protein
VKIVAILWGKVNSVNALFLYGKNLSIKRKQMGKRPKNTKKDSMLWVE